MPARLAPLIDNRLRYVFQPPGKTAERHGLAPGMTVLEVGPGSGTYTLAAARSLGENGKLVAVDIQPEIAERAGFERRVRRESISATPGLDRYDVQMGGVPWHIGSASTARTS
jgi:predicted methyltransferase